MTAPRTVHAVLRRMLLSLSAIIVAITGLSVVSVLLIQHEVVQVAREMTPLVDDSNRMRIAVTDAQTSYRTYLLTQDVRFLDDYQQSHRAFQDAQGAFDDNAAAIGRPEMARDFEEASATYFDLIEVEVEQLQDGAEPAIEASSAAFADITERHTALAEDISQVRQERRDRYSRLMTGFALATGVAGAGGLVVARRQSRLALARMAQPLEELEAVVSGYRNGSSELRADTTTGATEVIAVAAAFNELADTNARLQRSRERQLELYRLTLSVAGQLSSDAENWDRACTTIGEGLQVDQVELHEVVGRTHRNLLGSPPGGAMLEELSSEDLEVLLQGGRLVVSNAAQLSHAVPSALAESAARHGIRSWVLVPLTMPDNDLGVLCVARSHAYRWPGGELDALDRVAGYLTTALAVRRLVASLTDLDRQKSDFMATTSHELRTPLTSMTGYLELLEDGDFGPLTDRQAGAVAVVSRNVGRLRALIDDLLLLNRLDSGQASTHRTEVDAREVVTQVVESLAPVAAAARVDVVVQQPARSVTVRGNREQLERAVSNLVSNAIKFTGVGGQVRLSSGVEQDTVQLECTDTGIGIPEADLPRIFTRFYRATNAQESQVQGTGLGLVIVRTVAEAHGGTVELSSQEGLGTTVTMRLPCSTGDGADLARPPA